MHFLRSLLVTLCHLTAIHAFPLDARTWWKSSKPHKITPKFFIISMVIGWSSAQKFEALTDKSQFAPEANIWYKNMPSSGLGDLLGVNITVPGLSMLFPDVHCLPDHSVCQITTGESEINAAASITALVYSGKFDLTKTYFMVGGIAGINPKQGTLGSVALAKYAVQVALQYEFDAREMPDNFTTGYFSYGTYLPNTFPKEFYGTEVFEVNEALRDIAYGFAIKGNLSDDAIAAEYRAKYAAGGEVYTLATEPPSVIKCDSATSDVYYSGVILGEAFENVTKIWTNGTGEYCMTAQEDNATLEVMVRAAIQGLVDYSRIIIMRTGKFAAGPMGRIPAANPVQAPTLIANLPASRRSRTCVWWIRTALELPLPTSTTPASRSSRAFSAIGTARLRKASKRPTISAMSLAVCRVRRTLAPVAPPEARDTGRMVR